MSCLGIGERITEAKTVFFLSLAAFWPFFKVGRFWCKWLVERRGREGGWAGCLGREAVSRGQRPHLQSTALPMAQRVHQVKKNEILNRARNVFSSNHSWNSEGKVEVFILDID